LFLKLCQLSDIITSLPQSVSLLLPPSSSLNQQTKQKKNKKNYLMIIEHKFGSNNFPELRCSAISSPISPSIERIEHSSTIPNFNYNTIEHMNDFSDTAPNHQPLIERNQLSLGKWENRDNHIGSSRSSSETPLSSRVLNAQGLLFSHELYTFPPICFLL